MLSDNFSRFLCHANMLHVLILYLYPSFGWREIYFQFINRQQRSFSQILVKKRAGTESYSDY